MSIVNRVKSAAEEGVWGAHAPPRAVSGAPAGNREDAPAAASEPAGSLAGAGPNALYANMCGLGEHLNTEELRPQVATFFNLEILRQTGPEEEEPEPVPPVVPPVP